MARELTYVMFRKKPQEPKPVKRSVVVRKKRKSAADRKWDQARERCRFDVWRRQMGCCARCGVPLKLKPSEARHEFEIMNVDEEPPRSKGGDPLNPRDCIGFCYKCHRDKHDEKFEVVWSDPEKKALAPFEFEEAA